MNQNLYVRHAPDSDRVTVEPPRTRKDHAQAKGQSDDAGLDVAGVAEVVSGG